MERHASSRCIDQAVGPFRPPDARLHFMNVIAAEENSGQSHQWIAGISRVGMNPIGVTSMINDRSPLLGDLRRSTVDLHRDSRKKSRGSSFRLDSMV